MFRSRSACAASHALARVGRRHPGRDRAGLIRRAPQRRRPWRPRLDPRGRLPQPVHGGMVLRQGWLRRGTGGRRDAASARLADRADAGDGALSRDAAQPGRPLLALPPAERVATVFLRAAWDELGSCLW